MDRTAIEKKMREIILEQLGVPQETIKPDAKFADDFGADSLDAVELMMSIEDEFQIWIPDDEAAELKTVQQAVDYIQRRLHH